MLIIMINSMNKLPTLRTGSVLYLLDASTWYLMAEYLQSNQLKESIIIGAYDATVLGHMYMLRTGSLISKRLHIKMEKPRHSPIRPQIRKI